MNRSASLARPLTRLALGLLLVSVAARTARASPLDLGGCASAQAAMQPNGGGGFSAGHLVVRLGSVPDASLHAESLTAAIRNANLPPGALPRASTALAASLLAAIAHQRDACPDSTLRQAASPLAHAIGDGGETSFTWTGLSIHVGTQRFGARRLTLRLSGAGPTARLEMSADGLISNDAAAAVLPQTVSLHATVPADQVAPLLSAAGGNGEPVSLTIEHLHAQRGDTSLDGQGHATIAPRAADSSGDGHLTVHGYDQLLDAASGLDRLRTALFLARLVAHRNGDAADWDLSWQAGTLLVNNVPLPLR